jgi:endonuclease/exonuclease/phosphatase family metal-dependent hydrolase
MTRKLLASLAVVAAATVTSVAVPSVADAAVAFQVGTFNMAGGHDVHGEKGDEVPEALERSINNRNPAIVMLQEACRDWSEHLRATLTNYTVKFDPVLTGAGEVAKCKHDSEFGNAILHRDDLGLDVAQPWGHELGSPAGSEQREMLCIRLVLYNVAACSVHLTGGRSDAATSARLTEVKSATDFLADTYTGSTHILGGDLNASPLSRVTSLLYHDDYGLGAVGEYKEVDSPCRNTMGVGYPISVPPFFVACRGGEETHNAGKIDHIFVSPAVTVHSADATNAIHSDHDPLWADISF